MLPLGGLINDHDHDHDDADHDNGNVDGHDDNDNDDNDNDEQTLYPASCMVSVGGVRQDFDSAAAAAPDI